MRADFRHIDYLTSDSIAQSDCKHDDRKRCEHAREKGDGGNLNDVHVGFLPLRRRL